MVKVMETGEGMRRYLLFKSSSVGMGELAVFYGTVIVVMPLKMGNVVNLIVVLFFLRQGIGSYCLKCRCCYWLLLTSILREYLSFIRY